MLFCRPHTGHTPIITHFCELDNCFTFSFTFFIFTYNSALRLISVYFALFDRICYLIRTRHLMIHFLNFFYRGFLYISLDLRFRLPSTSNQPQHHSHPGDYRNYHHYFFHFRFPLLPLFYNQEKKEGAIFSCILLRP